MPVSLPLSNEEAEAVRQAAKNSKMEVAFSGRRLELTTANFIPIRESIKAFHAKKRAIKTRTVLHLETCFNLEQVLSKMERLAGDFGVPATGFTPEPENDNVSGPIEVTEEPTVTEATDDGNTDEPA